MSPKRPCHSMKCEILIMLTHLLWKLYYIKYGVNSYENITYWNHHSRLYPSPTTTLYTYSQLILKDFPHAHCLCLLMFHLWFSTQLSGFCSNFTSKVKNSYLLAEGVGSHSLPDFISWNHWAQCLDLPFQNILFFQIQHISFSWFYDHLSCP